MVSLCGAALAACGISLDAVEPGDASLDVSSSGSPTGSSGAPSSSGAPGSSSSSGSSTGSSGAPTEDAAADAALDAGTDAGDEDGGQDAGPPPVCEPVEALPLCDGFSRCVGDAEVASGGDNVRLTGKDTNERGILWLRRTLESGRAFTLQVEGTIDQDDVNVGHGLAVSFLRRTDGADDFPGIAGSAGSTLGLASGNAFASFAGHAGYLRTVSNASAATKTGQLVLGTTGIPTQSSNQVDGFADANGDPATPTFDRGVTLRYRLVVSHAANAPTARMRLQYGVGESSPYSDLARQVELALPERVDFVGVGATTGNSTRSRHRVRAMTLSCD